MASTGSQNPGMMSGNYLSDYEISAFPRAPLYQELHKTPPPAVREAATRRKAFPYSERHLHCAWFDPGLRPVALRTHTGETVTVEHPGTWNQEAGPDFLGGVLRIGPHERRLAGDVEIHIHPSDWKAHGHDADPRYRDVRFHVTYFPGSAHDIDRLPGTVHIALKDALAACPGFSFEHIDPSAYPYAARADMPPCSTEFQTYDVDARIDVLQAAGEARLRRKAERMTDLIRDKGMEQALYEELMAALGYKHNKSAFRHLAAALPLEELRRIAEGDAHTAYALLMGAAGLLPEQRSKRWSDETARCIRSLWDVWWRYRHAYGDHATRCAWRLDGIRPANHPARRLMAAAQLVTGRHTPVETIRRRADDESAHWTDQIIAYFHELYDPYMSHHLGFNSTRRAAPVALIGRMRAASMLTNVIIPFLAATGVPAARITAALDRLPVEPDNGIIKQTAFYLFGRDHAPSLYRSELARQGLIQIFQDFCLNDRSRCAHCRFPHALRAHRKGA